MEETTARARRQRVRQLRTPSRANRPQADAAIDKLHMDFPFMGARMLRNQLNR
jgi:hypothetical protein